MPTTIGAYNAPYEYSRYLEMIATSRWLHVFTRLHASSHT